MLTVDNLQKAYGPTRALRSFGLHADARKILGIVGPNGAGKSTFVKVLAGEESEDDGTISYNDTPLSLEVRRDLVAVVHQEPQLFPNLTVADNLLIGRQGVVRPRPTSDALSLLERLQIGEFAGALLGTTSIVVWQLTEIARALLRSADIFVFDEPNSALTKEESQQLFELMRRLRDSGKLVILVSHRLAEVAEICEVVVAVRDGSVATTLSGSALSTDNLASVLSSQGVREVGATGTEGTADPFRSNNSAGPREKAATADHKHGCVVPLDDEAAIEGLPGVVVAVTGPEGGGGRELTRAASLAGATRRHIRRAVMPSDRRQSLFFNMSVAANISSRLDRRRLVGGSRWLTRRALAQAADSYIEGFGIKTEHAGATVASLSGGNQQKVALASALAVQPELLIVEEPTRGVDVGTKRQIFGILRTFASAGGAVVMFVTELEDAIGCADRLVVVNDAAIQGSVDVSPSTDLESLGVQVNRLLSGHVHVA